MKKKSKKKALRAETSIPAFTPSAEYRPAPTNFRAVEENGCVTLSWDAQPDAVSYNIWRSINGQKTVVIAGTKETSYIDCDVIHGFACYYGLHSRDVEGFSAQYANTSITPKTAATTLKISINTKRVTGGETSKITVTADQVSPFNTGVMLATDSKSLELPPHLILPPNEKSATIEVMTQKVMAVEFATLSVSCGDSFQSTMIFIEPSKSK